MMRDLTPDELRHADRDLLAGRLAALQAERAELREQLEKPCGECHPCDHHSARTVEVTPAVIMAFIQAPDEPDGDIGGPLRVAFRAAGLTVAGDLR